MNNFVRYFSYNWFQIFKKNIKNNRYTRMTDKKVFKLVIKKEICSIIFIILNFLVTYFSSLEVYKLKYTKNIFFHILKDNFSTSFTWFIILSILPFISIIFFKKRIKNKYYLILDILYILSTALNILTIIYFITCLITNIALAVLGFINIIAIVIINSNIIIKINENYLIH
ncbi:MAG: hypothetical protein J6D28_02200 [Bacilli bacterium]|nr:hypothetical protein [Bacilli bacterium]